ncbi:MAG: phage shock protein C [Alphaproteobacteria bacterium]|nr:MAG: phage shock protein C [Caulobacteraceae bacterium]TPW04253.1 MAG: phage shock protein C [Alphaproteobacteria bacterium]
MEHVVTINLNGNAFQLEQGAYDALRKWLDAAETGLKDNPDRAEILSDLEQAVADKCAGVLGARKTVVSGAEMGAILKEMGPVTDTESTHEQAEAPNASSDADKRLYRLREGAMFAGVCSGIAAYFKTDPTLVRFIFVVATVLTQGAGLLVYAVMMFVVPSAQTSAEWAAAHGLPFNAQEVIDGAKKQFAEIARNQQSAWRRRERRRRTASKMSAFATPAPQPHVGYGTQMLAGVVASICALVEASLGLALVFTVWSLFTTGAVLGVEPPADWSLWGAIFVAAFAIIVATWPFRAMRRASFAALGYNAAASELSYGLFSFIFTVGGLWYAYQYWPAAREVIAPIYQWFRAIVAPGGF